MGNTRICGWNSKPKKRVEKGLVSLEINSKFLKVITNLGPSTDLSEFSQINDASNPSKIPKINRNPFENHKNLQTIPTNPQNSIESFENHKNLQNYPKNP